MESTLQIMPVQRTSRNFGEFAEEAVIIEEPIIKQKRPLFIEANTIEASLEHLRNDCIIPCLLYTSRHDLHQGRQIRLYHPGRHHYSCFSAYQQPNRISHIS